ncbi:MAG: hypothetical protein QNJ45_23140 [Ardenticatenaceae bacterium]|nr:hypothetical protein [Ardenticatenaceae bacterium]
MTIRLLLVTPHHSFESLMNKVLDTALELTGLDAVLNTVFDLSELRERVDSQLDDVILLDWDMVQAETPALVKEVLTTDPRLRLVAMLPLSNRQYRQKVWAAGACNGIPKEHVDQEWMATVLCIMQRAMEREARLLQTFS